MFIMRAWRNWTLKTQTTSFECMTANTYACLEINAHNLILAARNCRNRGRPDEFLVKHFGSQDVEKLFRNLRSMTTMNHTQTNLTFKELGEKLRRSNMLDQIQHRNGERYKFPGQPVMTSLSQAPILPTDAEIRATLTRAEAHASDALDKVGLRDQQSFEFSLIALGDRNWEQVIASDTESDTDVEVDDAGQHVYEARDLFSNFSGRIELPDSASYKQVYLVRDDEGKVCRVKKNTIVWMLTSTKVQETTARMVRFKQSRSSRRPHHVD